MLTCFLGALSHHEVLGKLKGCIDGCVCLHESPGCCPAARLIVQDGPKLCLFQACPVPQRGKSQYGVRSYGQQGRWSNSKQEPHHGVDATLSSSSSCIALYSTLAVYGPYVQECFKLAQDIWI